MSDSSNYTGVRTERVDGVPMGKCRSCGKPGAGCVAVAIAARSTAAARGADLAEQRRIEHAAECCPWCDHT